MFYHITASWAKMNWSRGDKRKQCVTLPCQILSSFRSCLCLAESINSYHSLIPPPSIPSLTLLGYVQKRMPVDEFGQRGDVGTCLCVQSTWWCVSCQPDGNGCRVETYSEFKLCPSHWSLLACWLTSLQRSHPKNKGVQETCVHMQAETWVYASTPHQITAETHAHKASSNYILLQKQNQPPVIKRWYNLASPSLPWSLSPINMLPCIKVYMSSQLHHRLECFD